MGLVRVFTPNSASEQAVVVAMLEAHSIPTHIPNGHMGSMLPGLVVNAYNSTSVMVPAGFVDAATDLIQEYRRAGESLPTGPAHGQFVAFHEAEETTDFRGERLHFAVMIARSPEGVVLVFNKFRRVWELPGGLIDAGDDARTTAARELREEAGNIARDVRWLGVVEVTDGNSYFGGVFDCEVDTVEFVENEEMSGLAYWLPDRPPPGMGFTDEALLDRFGSR
jgi:8-oxo-dGTP pyrophosphatase MutT (NUDIX family)